VQRIFSFEREEEMIILGKGVKINVIMDEISLK
jgi:hypothetical protein